MIITVTGGRYVPGTRYPLRLDREQILAFRELLKLLAGRPWEAEPHDGRLHRVRSGHAIGTDQHVESICKKWGVPVDPYPVDTSVDGDWPAAGHRRNERMLRDELQSDFLAAFPGGNGTAGCVKAAGRLDIPVFEWRYLTRGFCASGLPEHLAEAFLKAARALDWKQPSCWPPASGGLI